jgi:hypothetical protein
VRLLIRSRRPVLALLLFAPAIPELLTGSTPITPLFYNPFAFLLSFGFDVALYGTGALLIREFAVAFHKGWASILLAGAAYGIAEEGFAVHTFFEPSGNPVGLLAVYGHAFGVNWLWALGLTVFHATYSISLPILLTQLWFPEAKGVRWLDRAAVGLVGAIYLLTVVVFDLSVGHPATPAAFALFLAFAIALLWLAYRIPGDFLAARPGPTRLGPGGLVIAGALSFLAWIVVLLMASARLVPAAVAAIFLGIVNVAVLILVVRRVGTDRLDWSKFYFATGMLGILFVWDAAVAEFMVPGILLVSLVFAYLQYRLRNALRAREARVPTGAIVGPPA